MAKKHLVIGCGVAALSALEEIRRITAEDEVTLITKEDFAPYSPAILPYVIAGRAAESEVALRDAGYFDRMKANLVKGKEVVSLAPEKKEVTYNDGQSEKYDSLLLACGAHPVRLPIKGLDKASFLGLHTLADCRRLLRELNTRKEVAIYGAGFVASELAVALLERGCPVKLIVRSWVLRRYFDRDVAAIIENMLVAHGAQVLSGQEIAEVKKSNGKLVLLLSGGGSVTADILINAVGVEPNTTFIKEAGIKVNRGVLVDRQMKTSADGVYAAGDVSEAPEFLSGEAGPNPILPSAIEQGRVAGANMAGKTTSYEGWIPTNIYNFFGKVSFSAGLAMPSNGAYQVLMDKKEASQEVRKLVFQDGRLVGAMFLGVDVLPGVIYYLIKHQVDVGADKELLLQRPREVGLWLMQEAEKKKTVMGA
ncbi:MAG: NAD(P)/FAD-dependent oxidoreductase [Chloroflexi bacterium]|nr:NAD(P)/FAD-dependent oxidoreductase [Chloroflexota bacterium]